MYNVKKAFTLAELLITLAVVGVVSALVINGIITTTQNQEFVTGLKKSYATIDNAFRLLKVDYNCDTLACTGIFNQHDADTNTNYGIIWNMVKPRLNIAVDCGQGKGCWFDGYVKYLAGDTKGCFLASNIDSGTTLKAVLADGTSISFIPNSNCTSTPGEYANLTGGACTMVSGIGVLSSKTCGNIVVDVNGARGPNTYGRDIFKFFITTNAIVPDGNKDTPLRANNRTCNPALTANGVGCAAKVLQDGAMNY